MPLFLLAAAVGIAAVAVILLVWRFADRRVKDAYSDVTLKEVEKQLREALDQQALLTARVEHLEAIVVSETFEDNPAPPLTLPDEPADVSNEEKVARLAQRRRSR